MRSEPTDVQLSDGTKKVMLSAVVGKKAVFVMSMSSKDAPLDLQFVPKYGDVVAHRWASDDELVIAFTSGLIIGLSTHEKTQGKELFKKQLYRSAITGLQLCPTFKKAAVKPEIHSEFAYMSTYRMPGSDTGPGEL
jgi:hypothetical protein